MAQEKTLVSHPSSTPSSDLYHDQGVHHGAPGAVARLNQILERYAHLIRTEALRLNEAERQVLVNVLSDALIDACFLTGLEQAVYNSSDYQEGVEGAETLLEKVVQASYVQRLATIETLGF